MNKKWTAYCGAEPKVGDVTIYPRETKIWYSHGLYHIRDMRFEAKELTDRTGTGYPEFEVVAFCGRVLHSEEDYWMTARVYLDWSGGGEFCGECMDSPDFSLAVLSEVVE